MKSIAHIPFKGPAPSESMNVNFLTEVDNTYYTDNHRVALWCLAQKIETNKKYNYFHIDAHYDALAGAVSDFHKLKVDLKKLPIDEFLTLPTSAGKPNLIRFDNYHPVFFDIYSEQLSKKYFLTHRMGKAIEDIVEIELNSIFEVLDSFQGQNNLINIDLDYFVSRGENKICLVSDQVIEKILSKIEMLKPACVIYCLSPECSGGWKSALDLAEKFKFIIK